MVKKTKRLCYLPWCDKFIAPWEDYCRGHWFSIPKELQDRLRAVKDAGGALARGEIRKEIEKTLREKRDEKNKQKEQKDQACEGCAGE